MIGDIRELHCDPANANALFQVASQFNLLEMVNPEVTPEHGVTRYAFDQTQGPACAIAAGAATVYRNYFAQVNGSIGQTSMNQIDCLSGVGEILGNTHDSLWSMSNGYALCSSEGLSKINDRRCGSNQLFLTQLGGGAFGNESSWIYNAMTRAFSLYKDFDLDIKIVSYGSIDMELHKVVDEGNQNNSKN